ncbi:ribonuclease P protein component [Alphaproteobacteria bacterium]|jgi:ribonuclease P protein component|uniref:ribonuclease P protein component n=1 Tax=Candidatus Levibacter sp. Uisw_134_01 TaxID=3230999 RepID=UPI0023385136|nr:ribonuclease P protein component [Alphaproteobacteria bacterium]
MKLQTLKHRKDFVLSNKFAKKIYSKNFIIQKYTNSDSIDLNLKFGFTATKKIGNAVTRNRAKRRMRALVSRFVKEDINFFDNKSSYVLVAKSSLNKALFINLYSEMQQCLNKL